MKFRKKPIVIEAEQFFVDRYRTSTNDCYNQIVDHGDRFTIETLEGDMEVIEGDWIIRGIAGEYYPCKPDIFEQTYERLEK